jgi:hypothetical protein
MVCECKKMVRFRISIRVKKVIINQRLGALQRLRGTIPLHV